MEKSLEQLKQEYEKTTVPVSYTHLADSGTVGGHRRSSVQHLQQTKKGLNFMSILQTIDLKKYYGTEPVSYTHLDVYKRQGYMN